MTTSDLNKQTFLKLANDLAIYFPDYLLHTPEGHWNVYFEHKTIPSKGFYLNPNNSTGKFTVIPKIVMTPNYGFGEVYTETGEKVIHPACGFSIDRPADKVAAGIKSRFIPEFENYYIAWMNQWKRNHDYKTNKDTAIKEVASLMEIGPVEYQNGSSKELREQFGTYHSKNEKLKEYVYQVRISSPDSIKIELDLNMEKARKVIELLKNL